MSTHCPGYEELTACLNANNSDLTAAECHAITSAMLSCQGSLDEQSWARRILSGELEADPSEAPLGSSLHEQDIELIARLATDTQAQLQDPELTFSPLLPDDDDSIEERSVALSEWCHGYLYGLSLGGLKEFKHLSEQAQEFIRDIVEISALEVASDETEANEAALFEVIEYLRMGVLMIRDELSSSTPSPTPDEQPAPTVH